METEKKLDKQRGNGELHLMIDFQYPSGPAVFSNHFMVQFDSDEVHLVFFEIQPPIFMGETEEIGAQAAAMKSIPARAVSRIVVSKSRIASMAKVLIESIKKNMGEDALK